jgi:hypothetical protein
MKKDEPAKERKEPEQSEDGTPLLTESLVRQPTFSGQPKVHDAGKPTKQRQNRMRPLKAIWGGIAWLFGGIVNFLDEKSGFVTATATIVIAYLTFQYVTYSKKQWETMRDANTLAKTNLIVSQRAYVTIGRKDGVIGEFIVPTSPKAIARIVFYFQNNGHVPAKINWELFCGHADLLRDPLREDGGKTTEDYGEAS